jgi:hypothetical protein
MALEQHACMLGAAGACVVAGLSSPDYSSRAIALYERACTDEAEACWLSTDHTGFDPFDHGCASAHTASGEACSLLGEQLLKQDTVRSLAAYEAGCAKDHAPSCGIAAVLLHAGQNGVSKDDAKALTFNVKACEGDVAQSCETLGFLALNRTVPDKSLAARSFAHACRLGEKKYCAPPVPAAHIRRPDMDGSCPLNVRVLGDPDIPPHLYVYSDDATAVPSATTAGCKPIGGAIAAIDGRAGQRLQVPRGSLWCCP